MVTIAAILAGLGKLDEVYETAQNLLEDFNRNRDAFSSDEQEQVTDALTKTQQRHDQLFQQTQDLLRGKPA